MLDLLSLLGSARILLDALPLFDKTEEHLLCGPVGAAQEESLPCDFLQLLHQLCTLLSVQLEKVPLEALFVGVFLELLQLDCLRLTLLLGLLGSTELELDGVEFEHCLGVLQLWCDGEALHHEAERFLLEFGYTFTEFF